MKLKARPEDFRVRELFDLTGLTSDGPFAIYRVEKRGLSTIEASLRLARAAGVPTDSVRFAGLKDRHAVTEQFLSVEGGEPTSIEEEELTASIVGWSTRPVTSERLSGNAFEIVARDLDDAEAARLRRGAEEIRSSGLPSYFDDQRFGAARSGKGFPALELLRRRPEEALRLLVATPASIDGPDHRARKEALAAAWGRFEECLRLARGWHEQAIFRHLRARPGDFRGALRFVPRRERLMQLFAYQSAVWNRALDSLVRARVPAGRRCAIPAEMGELAAWRALAPEELAAFDATDLRLPSDRTAPPDPEVRAALEAALAADGLTIGELRIRGLRGFELREERRPVVLRPPLLEVGEPAPDELHPGRRRVEVRLELPRGAYATLVLKRALA